MAEHPGLLRAIIDDPDADDRRLIYADWLDDHGEEARAEFIRVQVELSLWGDQRRRPRAYGNWYVDCRNRADYPGTEAACHAPPSASQDVCEYHALRRRELELFGRHGAGWFGPTGCLTPPNGRERQAGGEFRVVRRGFVEHVTLPMHAWYGGLCGRCRGTGCQRPYHPKPGCVGCCADCRGPDGHGTGRVVGHGPALCRAAPLTRVTLSDRQPQQWHGCDTKGSLFGWWQAENGPCSPRHSLPGPLWETVYRHRECIDNLRWADFRTEALALDALSDALLDWAKGQPAPTSSPPAP